MWSRTGVCMTDLKTKTMRCGALILLCASALSAGDGDIASFAGAEPLAPGREILAEPVEGTLFLQAAPEDAKKGLLLFRRKNADNGYELFAGRHVAATVEGLSAFPLGGMTPEKALKTRFYRKLRQPKFQDEPLVYVDSERIYCSGLSKAPSGRKSPPSPSARSKCAKSTTPCSGPPSAGRAGARSASFPNPRARAWWAPPCSPAR